MFPGVSFSRTRTAPTGYEKVRLLFHTIRTAQLLSSLVVGCILIYFIWWLAHDHYSTPWTFVVLVCVSLLTVVFLTATIIFHFLTGLSPRLNLALNTILLVLWTMGFGMLTYYMTDTLSNRCDIANWEKDTGVMVCRIYKTLFTFSLLGLSSTVLALLLDIHIQTLATRFGKHMRLDNLDQKRRSTAARGPYTDTDDVEGRPSDAFEVPTIGYGAQNGATFADASYVGGADNKADGYAVPEGQFEYDTGYHGGHEARAMQ